MFKAEKWKNKVSMLCNLSKNQINSVFSAFVAGSKVKSKERDLLMKRAMHTASLLCCMRQVGYHLRSQPMEYILTDLESTCQVR